MLSDKKWIFFDLGSTLVDESEAYRQRVLEMLKGTNIAYDDFMNTMLGCYRQGGKGDKLAAAHYGLTLPKWRSEFEFLFADTVPCLQKLNEKYKLGVIANQLPGTYDRLRKFGIAEYFSLVLSSSEEGVAKPDPRIFELALTRAHCPAHHAVMIGDRMDNDIAPANRLGMTTVRILRGYSRYSSPLSADEMPDYTVGNLDEICALLM